MTLHEVKTPVENLSQKELFHGHPTSDVTIKAASVSISSNTFTRQEIFTLEDAFRGRCNTHRGVKVKIGGSSKRVI